MPQPVEVEPANVPVPEIHPVEEQPESAAQISDLIPEPPAPKLSELIPRADFIETQPRDGCAAVAPKRCSEYIEGAGPRRDASWWYHQQTPHRLNAA